MKVRSHTRVIALLLVIGALFASVGAGVHWSKATVDPGTTVTE